MLIFEPVLFVGGVCDDCPKVSVQIPKAQDGSNASEKINRGIEEEVIALLTFEEGLETSSIPGAIDSFTDGYENLRTKYPGEVFDWEAKITAEVTYEDPRMITIRINSYMFTGGAHGYGTTQFLNFDKRKGTRLKDWELFSNRNEFRQFAESKFRQQEAIPNGRSINSTGFMFERDVFHLPKNIGFTHTGIQLHYNQYEVASYADGPVELVLPFKEVKKYLSGKIKS